MRSFLIAMCLVLVAWSSFAQSDRGTITGTISDPASAVVPGAKIEAKNAQTDAVYNTASTTAGNYTLAQLPAGTYQISASMPGFKKYVRTGITVLVAQTLRIDVKLEVGNITEMVEVNADAPLLRTESGELSDNIKIDRMDNLPILSVSSGPSGIRNPYAITQLIPGSSYSNNSVVRVNGTPGNTQALRIEGQDSTTGLLSGTPQMTAPSVDAIQEYSVQSSNYAAEYGQAGGAVFNATMKSGTNAFHGTVYDYFVNEALNANTPYSNVKPRQRRNDYGFTFGGPVQIPRIYDGHDKTFFFFNFEQFRETLIYNNLPVTVPTQAFRNGDFSSLLTGTILGTDPAGQPIYENQIYDPHSTQTVKGVTFRLPFMGCDGQHRNVICTDPSSPRYTALDPVALKVQNYIPMPNRSASLYPYTSNYLPTFTSPTVTTIAAVKIDHQLSAKMKLSGYYSHSGQTATNVVGLGSADGLPEPITRAQGSFNTSHTIRLSLDDSITPTMLLHVGVGTVHYLFRDDATVTNFDVEKELGLKGTYAMGRFPYFTGLTTGAYGGTATMGPYSQTHSNEERPTANASLTWVRSTHTFKIGADIILDGYPTTNLMISSGQFNFSSNETGLPVSQPLGGKSVGFAYASFLLGAVDSGNVGVPARHREGNHSFALFVQDSWKVTQKFTLDYGLRWDYQTYLSEQYGRLPSFGATTPNPKADNMPGAYIFEGYGPGRCNCKYGEIYPYAFGPRLGAAYQILPKTVFRAGIGIVYSKTASNGMVSISGVAANNNFVSLGLNQPAMWLKDGLPVTAVWPNFDPGQQPVFAGTIGTAPTLVDRNAGRPPRQIQWSIGIQREITKDLAVDIAYVANRGVWWQANSLLDLNRLTPQILADHGLDISNAADRTLLMTPLASQTRIAAPYASFPKTQTVAQALRPYPQFGSIGVRWAPLGKTWYDSLQVRVIKRFSHNLDFTYNFAWQKELTLGAESEGGGGVVNDVLNRGVNKYISQYSQPLQSTLAATYTLPKWGKNKVLSLLVRDWQISAMLQYKSGLPIRAPGAQNLYATQMLISASAGGPFADRVSGEPLFTKDLNCTTCFDPNRDFVLNPKAWADPSGGRVGTSAAYYSDYRYRRRPSENMSLGRIFRIQEKVNLNIRAEFTNIFNRIQPNNPSSTNALSTQTRNSTGKPLGGFGYIDTATAGSPRGGMIVARLQF
jgi:hypothetical protein